MFWFWVATIFPSMIASLYQRKSPAEKLVEESRLVAGSSRGIENGLVRITTRIGHFVIQAWRTEGIRPGVVAASHHMGRWRIEEDKARSWGAGKATIDKTADGKWKLTRNDGIRKFDSDDPDSNRIWWNDTGVHQNLTFSVQPDPVSGMHCWLQRVKVTPAEAGDQYGDVVVDTKKSREAYLDWMTKTRPGPGPDGLRRPLWYARPLKPSAPMYHAGD